MRMVLDVSRMLAVPTEIDALLCRIAEAATVLLNCERSSIFLYDGDRKELWTKVALGLVGTKEIRVPCNKGIVGHAFTANEILHVPDPYADPRFNPEPDRKSGFRTRNLLTVPMKDLDGKPLGVIQAVNKCDGPFAENDTSLVQLLAEQAGVAIQRHNLQMDALQMVGLRKEMDLARKAQQALIPKNPPGVPGLEAAGWTLPASVTGGDCFDLWRMPDGRLGVLVADASGHGLAPALIVSQVRTLVRALSEVEPDPHQLLARVNARLAADLEWGQFVTAFLGFLDPEGTLRWSSAGHGPTFLRPRCGDPVVVLEPPVQPLGVIAEWFDGGPPPARVEPTGSLVLISDGIFEANNAAGDLFSIERVVAILDAQPHDCTPHQVMAAVRDAVREWHGSAEPLDDQTIVVVQRDGPGTAECPEGLGA
jgi:phosphoserine phosphatase